MIYAFLGSLLAGGLAVAFFLWRKSVVEKERDVLKIKLQDAEAQNAVIMKTIADNQAIYEDQLGRRDSQIAVIRKERDDAIDRLVKSGAPGSVGSLLRESATNKGGTGSHT